MTDAVPRSDGPHRFTERYEFDADFRGETLHYIEPGCRTSMIWTWTNGYRISASSIQIWRNPDGSQSQVSEEERSEIIRRAIKYARDVQHVKLIVED